MATTDPAAPPEPGALPDPDPEPRAGRGPASVVDIFLTFTQLALHGFGGVLPWAQRMLVDRRGWLTQEEFVELLAFGQLFPGPNVINVSLMVGDRFFGWRGAAAALAGMLVLPSMLVLGLGLFYAHFADHPVVRRALDGMSAAAAGLIIAMALRMAFSLRRHWPWLGFGVAAFALVGLLRWPLALTLAMLAPVAIALAWRLRVD